MISLSFAFVLSVAIQLIAAAGYDINNSVLRNGHLN
jgi:hypothetical protein